MPQNQISSYQLLSPTWTKPSLKLNSVVVSMTLNPLTRTLAWMKTNATSSTKKTSKNTSKKTLWLQEPHPSRQMLLLRRIYQQLGRSVITIFKALSTQRLISKEKPLRMVFIFRSCKALRISTRNRWVRLIITYQQRKTPKAFNLLILTHWLQKEETLPHLLIQGL